LKTLRQGNVFIIGTARHLRLNCGYGDDIFDIEWSSPFSFCVLYTKEERSVRF